MIAIHNVVLVLILAPIVWGMTRVWKSPPVAHVLWLLLLIKLVTPPVLTLEIGNWNPVTVVDTEHLAPPREAPHPTVHQMRFPVDAASPEVVPPNQAFEFSFGTLPVTGDVSPEAPAVQGRITVAGVWQSSLSVLMWCWGVGIGIVAVRTVIRVIRFQRLLAGTLPVSRRIQSLADQLSTNLKLRQSPVVRVVDSCAAPFVWCVGNRATVVLSQQLLATLDESQVALVLAHELAHLHRRDHWVRLLELVVSLLYWWNPLVGWVRRQLHAAEEQCCDAWVLWVYPDQSHDYARSLFVVAELLPASTSPVLASSFLNRQTLKDRIDRILRNRAERTASRRAIVCVALFAALVIPAGLRSVAQERVSKLREQVDAPASADPSAAPVIQRNDLIAKPAEDPVAAAVPVQATDASPIPRHLQPFQGRWILESCGSLKWPATAAEARTWQWDIHGDQITWTRPGHEPFQMSFAVAEDFVRNPRDRLNDIDFTLLSGPDKGAKCPGSFYWFADTETVWFCFRDPGIESARPKKMGFNGYDRQTVIAMHPAPAVAAMADLKQPPSADVALDENGKPLAPQWQVLQGSWSFGACESVLWNTPLEELRKSWKWVIQGKEISWIRDGQPAVRMSCSIDPTKTPNEIDFTFLDGPDKGVKCQGIYEFERNNLWICLQEPGANVARPNRMEMSGSSHTALIVLHGGHGTDRPRPGPSTADSPAAVDPVEDTRIRALRAADLELFQGDFRLIRWISEKWPARSDEWQSWRWKIQGQQIVWTRPHHAPVTLSFSVNRAALLPQIDFTFLDGPDRGQKSLGIYLASRHELQICFQDPGAKVGRPANTGSVPGSQLTSLTLVPDRVLPVAEEELALQGRWKFDLYYSNWWPERISNPPITWKPWRWTVKGNEITWTGLKINDVKLSYTLDPSKTPRQIELTILDGEHKGTKLAGIYRFTAGGWSVCFADPKARVTRPTEFGFSYPGEQTWAEIEPARDELPVAIPPAAPAAAVEKDQDRTMEIDAAIDRLRKLGSFVREFHPRGNPEYWVQVISTGLGNSTRDRADNFDDTAMSDVETVARKVTLQLHLRNTSVTPAGLQKLASAGNITMLELSGSNVDDGMIKLLPKLPLRGVLSLNSDQLTDAGIRPVGECRDLEYVGLGGALLTNDSLENLPGLPKLHGVSLGRNFSRGALTIVSRIPGLTRLDASSLNPTLEDLMQVPKLRFLHLSGKQYGDRDAQAIAETFHSLEEAYLLQTSITNAGVKHLARLEKLKVLTLDNSLVDDGMAESLRMMKQLEWLSVGDCAVGDETVAAMSEHPELRYLFLVNTRVTDAGIAHLAKVKKPFALYLLYCKSLTDACIKSLAQLPNEPNMNLSLLPSGITAEGVRQLRIALPKAQIR